MQGNKTLHRDLCGAGQTYGRINVDSCGRYDFAAPASQRENLRGTFREACEEKGRTRVIIPRLPFFRAKR
jgi:hypothetical protein